MNQIPDEVMAELAQAYRDAPYVDAKEYAAMRAILDKHNIGPKPTLTPLPDYSDRLSISSMEAEDSKWLNRNRKALSALYAAKPATVAETKPDDDPHPTNCACETCEPEPEKIALLQGQIEKVNRSLELLEHSVLETSTGCMHGYDCLEKRIQALEALRPKPDARKVETHPNETARAIANRYISRSDNEQRWNSLVTDVQSAIECAVHDPRSVRAMPRDEQDRIMQAAAAKVEQDYKPGAALTDAPDRSMSDLALRFQEIENRLETLTNQIDEMRPRVDRAVDDTDEIGILRAAYLGHSRKCHERLSDMEQRLNALESITRDTPDTKDEYEARQAETASKTARQAMRDHERETREAETPSATSGPKCGLCMGRKVRHLDTGIELCPCLRVGDVVTADVANLLPVGSQVRGNRWTDDHDVYWEKTNELWENEKAIRVGKHISCNGPWRILRIGPAPDAKQDICEEWREKILNMPASETLSSALRRLGLPEMQAVCEAARVYCIYNSLENLHGLEQKLHALDAKRKEVNDGKAT